MFGRRVTLFKLFGFEVRVDMSWIIIAVIMTWSLASGLFPYLYGGLPNRTYWLMGIIGASGLFASIVFHEFFHSFVARHYGLPMKGITLFIFGGVSEMSDDPPNAKTEFLMAIAGPGSSLALSAGFYGVLLAGRRLGWSVPTYGVLNYLFLINAILAVFNLLPAFPLDGGRVLRSALWSWKGNIKWATHIASKIGSGFAFLMIAYGILNLVFGNFIGGIWWFLVGLFLRNASLMSYQQVLTREILQGEKVEHFMKPDSVTVTPTMSVGQLVQDFIYKYSYKMYPVKKGDNVVGCVNVDQIKQIPSDEWNDHAVAELAKSCSPDNTVTPQDDALDALGKMRKTGNTRLMVIEGKKLLGIITLKDLLEFLAKKIDLEGPVASH